ncbi:MAG: pilus assembly protein TadG-related protein [Pseudomonadota bacterium]
MFDSAHQGKNGQRGAIAIMLALMVIMLLGMMGMALDLAQLYNRQLELQHVANAAALVAARELNGSSAGIASAVSRAGTAAQRMKFQYNQASVSWAPAAISFGNTASGPWLDAGSAALAPDGLLFAKVDTSALDASVGKVEMAFMQLISSAFATTPTGARAIAGRSTINVTPLGVCAMSAAPAAARDNGGGVVELVEFGFRRGVGYDLMQLNPNGTLAETFLIDPLDPPGSAAVPGNLATAIATPFVCSGTMAMTRVSGGTLALARPFPLAALYTQLNSRFGVYTGALCQPDGAPPDTNVKTYPSTSIAWMSTAPSGQSALSTTSGSKLWTVADPLPGLAGTSAAQYGPLWSAAKAVPFSSYVPGAMEPANGYATYAASAWSSLYKPGSPAAPSYPGTLPYRNTGGSYFLAPTVAPGTSNRRLLNVALLACPVAAGSSATANVLGIGRFFMTVPATATQLFAEFAGAVPEQTLGGPVELYP